MRTKLVLVGLSAAYLLAAAACGARSELSLPRPAPQEAQGGGPPECVVFNSSTELAPLDVFIMLDASGSMQAPTGDGQIKWFAVREALNAFFYDPESRGIGVAVTFFPIVRDFIPQICTSDANCNQEGACKPLRICPTTGTQCQQDATCDAEGNGDSCSLLGQCSLAPQVQCVANMDGCTPAQGVCEVIGFCENRFTCESDEYEVPVVDVATLPDGAFGILNAIDLKSPEGGTPTLPALTGAVDQAVDHGEANPGNNVIVVLATDGVPTVCDDAIFDGNPEQATANLAAQAQRGLSEGIQTFVIGVFAPEEELAAEPSLTAIAQAGGTNQAFIVNTAGQVTDEFREALNQVRLNAKSCQFEILPSEDPIDYSGVWVRLNRNGEEVWIPRVDSLQACGPDAGFYYDQPITSPTDPSIVLLCPATCDLLGTSPDRTVEIFTTCGPGETNDG